MSGWDKWNYSGADAAALERRVTEKNDRTTKGTKDGLAAQALARVFANLGGPAAAAAAARQGLGDQALDRFSRNMGSAPAPVADIVASGGDPMAAFNEYVAGLPGVDRQDYVGPYEEAEAAARAAHGAAGPVIQGAFGGLRDTLQAGMADGAQQSAALRAALEERLAVEQGRVNGMVDPGLAGLAAHGVAPGMQAQAQSAVDMLRADGASADSRALALQDRIAQVQALSGQDRMADSRLAETGALANAQNNLGSILSQLLGGKAGAEKEFNADTAQRTQDLAKAEQEYRQGIVDQEKAAQDRAWELEDREFTREERAEKAAADATKTAAAEATAAEKAAKAAEKELPTPRAIFDQEYGSLAKSNPMEMEQFDNIIADAGNNVAAARASVRANAEAFAEDGINPELIMQWISRYYDDKTKVKPPQERTGGDGGGLLALLTGGLVGGR